MSLWPPKTWDRSTRVIVMGVVVGVLMFSGVFGRAFWYKYARESTVRQLREHDVTVEPRYAGRPQATTLQAGVATPSSYTITLMNVKSDEELAEIMELVGELSVPITLNISHSPRVTRLPGMEDDLQLSDITLTDNESLRSIDSLRTISALSSLEIINCPLETDWSFLKSLTQLMTVHLEDCGRIESGKPFQEHRVLNSLTMDTETGFDDLDFLGSLPALNTFVMGNATKGVDDPDRIIARLTDIKGLARCPTLRHVEIFCCDIDTTVPALDRLYALQHLELHGVKQQTSLDFLRQGNSYTVLRLTDWPELTDITGLRKCRGQQQLDLSGAAKLSDISTLLEDETMTGAVGMAISLRGTAVTKEQIEKLKENFQSVKIQSDFPTSP